MNNEEFYIEESNFGTQVPKFRYIVRHRGCFVVNDINRNWGSFNNHCTGCQKDIPKHLAIQRDLLNEQ